jgi:hypothetical protein
VADFSNRRLRFSARDGTRNGWLGLLPVAGLCHYLRELAQGVACRVGEAGPVFGK